MARKYKKTSKLGGYLDTISDSLLFLIFGDFIIKQLKLPKQWYTILILCFSIVMLYYDSWHDHKNVTEYKDNSINAVQFIANNTWVYFIIFIIVFLVIKDKKKLNNLT